MICRCIKYQGNKRRENGIDIANNIFAVKYSRHANNLPGYLRPVFWLFFLSVYVLAWLLSASVIDGSLRQMAVTAAASGCR
jgi:hypothetical protein